jgi:hypothetical protein
MSGVNWLATGYGQQFIHALEKIARQLKVGNAAKVREQVIRERAWELYKGHMTHDGVLRPTKETAAVLANDCYFAAEAFYDAIDAAPFDVAEKESE